jgi:hypothetical protein
MAMTRMLIVCASLAAAFSAAGCGGSDNHDTLTVPTTAYAKTQLPRMEPVHGSNHATQALEGAIARWVQWANRHYGKTELDPAGTSCEQQVEDLWNCRVTINVVKPFPGSPAGPVVGGYTVTRDTQRNQMVYIEGLSG